MAEIKKVVKSEEIKKDAEVKEKVEPAKVDFLESIVVKVELPCFNRECNHVFNTVESMEKAEKVGCPVCGVSGTKKLKERLDKRRDN